MRFGLFSLGQHKPYQGEVSPNRFKISRVIYYRNSFLPIIKGELKADLGGTRLDIKMSLHPFVIVFMAIWFGGVGLGAMATIFGALSTLIQEGITSLPSLFPLGIPWGMFIFGYLLVMGFFKFEAAKSKAFFQKLFESR